MSTSNDQSIPAAAPTPGARSAPVAVAPPAPPQTIAGATTPVPVPAPTTAPPPPATTAGILGGLRLTAKQESRRRNKAKETSLKMRRELWPEVDDDRLWLREDKTKKGFTTLPRTMPLLMNLIDEMSRQVTGGKAVPAGKAYLVLWCRVFDEGFLKIDSEAAAAFEAGYAGERNVSTWRQHLKVLRDLGFIDYKPGSGGPCQFVLLWNPYNVVKNLKQKGQITEAMYTALYQRVLEIGASDLDEPGLKR